MSARAVNSVCGAGWAWRGHEEATLGRGSTMKRLFLAAALAMGLTAPAWAGLDECKVAYESQDIEAVLRECKPLAEQGHPAAQYRVGKIYQWGHLWPVDYAESAKWLRPAAEQGYALA